MEVDMNDLSRVASIKSKMMSVYWQLKQQNGCTKGEASNDILSVIEDVIELENTLQSKIIDSII
ncbi:hypothetical protein NST58_06845 [Paenibacillus sp. FSL R10-2796]|jgi:hypothetical protein|uniref:hypothetical protein n=1 Tax=Paenibacillus sp. FSL R10-2796 TaxID=2954663 RepID=UPI0030DC7596